LGQGSADDPGGFSSGLGLKTQGHDRNPQETAKVLQGRTFGGRKMAVGEALAKEPRADRDMDGGRQKHAYLEGRPISAREAERRYGVPFKTVLRWAEAGLIRYLPAGREGKAYKLNEADVAYLAEIYRAAVERYGHFRGRRIRKLISGN
jgi:hypothetical protein